MASYFGKHIHVSIFGQSHSVAMGVSLDGLPAGEKVDLEALQQFLQRRAPGRQATATSRREEDIPQFLCGLVNGVTCGAPLAAIIENADVRPQDYEELRDKPRPAHADFTAQVKYRGYQDARGGGHFSGRLTAPLCVAGGICMQILARRGIQIGAHIRSIGQTEDRPFHPLGEMPETLEAVRLAPFPVLDETAGGQMQAAILEARAAGDSIGGIIECMAIGLPAGVGNPMFQGLESRLAAALFAVPAVKGVEFGSRFCVGRNEGLGAQRSLYHGGWNRPYPDQSRRRHPGGNLQRNAPGVPDGLQAHPLHRPESAYRPPVHWGRGGSANLRTARPLYCPPAVPVVEAVTALVLLDALLDRETDQLSSSC